jgi:hypothetical protein
VFSKKSPSLNLSWKSGVDVPRRAPRTGNEIGNMTNPKGIELMTQSNAAPTINRPTLTLAPALARPGRVAGISGRSVKVVTLRAVRAVTGSPAKPPTKASPAKTIKRPSPAKTKPVWKRPVSEYAIANRERSRHTRVELLRRFPECFGEPAKPLAMGIHEQLFEACPDIDRHALLYLLGEYTSTADYHRAMIAGADRVDLNGASVGVVTPSSVAYAKHRLKLFLAATAIAS